jgi:hypothetical protein
LQFQSIYSFWGVLDATTNKPLPFEPGVTPVADIPILFCGRAPAAKFLETGEWPPGKFYQEPRAANQKTMLSKVRNNGGRRQWWQRCQQPQLLMMIRYCGVQHDL